MQLIVPGGLSSGPGTEHLDRPREETGRWRLYALAWTPVLLAYFVFIAAASSGGAAGAALLALGNVVPAAIFGTGIVHVCRRWRWTAEARTRPVFFAAVHAAGALTYAVLWTAGLILLFSLGTSVGSGRPRLWLLSAAELQWQLGAGLLLYFTIASILYISETTQQLKEEEARVARAEALQARAELQALRERLDPHFLFNTLHSLLELVGSGDERAQDALEVTGDLFRYVYDKRRDAAGGVRLGEELTFVRSYLAVERLRLGDRLRSVMDVEPGLDDAVVPALLLQTLVENAVRHAAAVRATGCEVRVLVRREGGTLRIDVADDGPGADPAAIAVTEASGLGLAERRLRLQYGAAAGLSIDTSPGAGFRVALRLPLVQYAGSEGWWPDSAAAAGRAQG